MTLGRQAGICVWLVCLAATASIARSVESPPPMLPHPERIPDIEKKIGPPLGLVHAVAFSPDGKLLASGSEDHMVRVWDTATGQELRRLKGHVGGVTSVIFSPDGKLLASGSEDRTVRVWDAAIGQELRRLEGHGGSVSSVSFSPDGKLLASGSRDQTVRVWDADTGQKVRRLEGHGDGVNSVSFSPDGKLLAGGLWDQTVRVWDADTGQELRRLEGHDGGVHSVSFSPDGKLLASGSEDRTVRVWDAGTGQELRRLEGHGGGLNSVSFSPDGKLLASGSRDQTVRVWDAATGQELRRLEGHGGWVTSVIFSPDGKLLASGSEDKTVRVWDAATGQELRRLEGHGGWVSSVIFSPDGKLLASGSEEGTVRVWDAATGQELRRLEGHGGRVNSVIFSPDGKLLASGSEDRTVRVWDAATGQEVRRLKGHGGVVSSVSFSPDGKLLASGSSDRTVRLWDAGTGQELRRLEGHGGWVWSVSFSPDGKLLASGSEDGTLRVWDATTGQTVRRLEGHGGGVRSVSFSPDGKLLTSGSSDGTVRVWDAATGQELRRLEGHGGWVASVSFSPDGKLLASGSSDRTVRLWAAATGQELRRLEGHGDGVSSVSFSPDGKFLASGSYDRTVRLWDAAMHQELRRLEGHGRGVSSVSFSSDGKLLASGSSDQTVRVWDATTGQELRRLEGHGRGVSSVSFNPDGKLLASGSEDQTMRVWDAATGQELRRLEGHGGRVWSVSFSPDGKLLASGTGSSDPFGSPPYQTVRVWDTATGQELRRLEGHGNSVSSVSFSPDGKLLASCTGSSDRFGLLPYKTVRVWDATTGQELRRMEGHAAGVNSVSFSPDGKLLASGSDDQTVRVWDAATGQELRRLEGHAGRVWSVSFSPNGKRLASGSEDQTVRLWDVATGQELRRLEGHGGGARSVIFPPAGESAKRDGWPRLVVGCGDGLIIDWTLQPSEFVRGMVGSRRGCWATWNAAGEVVRFDDGTLIRDAPEVADVPKEQLVVDTPKQRVLVSYPGQNSFPITVRNGGAAPIYWPRVTAAVTHAKEKRKFNVIIRWPERATAVLEPGAYAEFTAVLVPRCEYENPTRFAEEIKFTATALNGEPSEFQVAAEFQTPELEVGPVVLDTRSDTPGIAVTVLNRGQTAMTSREVTVTLAPATPDVEGGEQRLAAIQVDLASGALRTLPLPLSDELAQRLRDSAHDGRWTVSVIQRDPVPHRWTSAPLPIQLPSVPWLLYSGLTFGTIALVLAGGYAGLFLHPDVRRVSRDPAAVLDTPVERVGAVRRLLGWTRRLPAVLTHAEVTRQRMDAAQEFLASRDAEHRCGLLTERLSWTARRLDCQGLDAFFAKVSSDFLLNLEQCLVVFPDPQTPIADWREALRQAEPNADRMLTIVVTTDAAHRERLLKVSREPTNMLVTASSRDLTGWLLSPQPERVVSQMIAGQVKVTRFSPYQSGGGLKEGRLFFGRQEILSNILNRDPANYFLVGARQSGKTSLLLQVQRLCREKCTLPCHFLTLTDQGIGPAIASVLNIDATGDEEVLRQLRQARGEESQAGRPRHETPAGSRSHGVLFLLDEADLFVEADAQRDFQVMRQMRAISAEGIAHFILAGFWKLYASVAMDYQSPIKNFGEILTIGPLETDACHDLAVQPMLGLGVRWEADDLVRRLIEQSGARPNLIAITCNEILKSLGTGGRVIDSATLDAALDSQPIRTALAGWEKMTGDEQQNRLDRILVYATAREAAFDMDGLLSRLKPFGLRYTPEDIRQSLMRLELAYIFSRELGRYKHRVPLFQKMIQDQAPEELLQREVKEG